MVIAATKVIFYTAPPSYWPKFVHPLMRLLMKSKEVERVVIVDLIIITKSVPVSRSLIEVGFTDNVCGLALVLPLLYSFFSTLGRLTTGKEGQDQATSQCGYG